ncbi:MAG: sulfatase-like hydrolase/transferase [Tangfeifania sp.]
MKIKNSYFITISLFLLVTIVSCNEQKQQPNIVLIMADDMGYECIGANGNTEYDTPNLDRLADSGVRFTNCYSQPLCTPSRVKIMTGKYNFRNYEDFGYLSPKEKTFGNLLKDAGYATCITGKWQLNGLNRDNPGNQDSDRPYQFGFDEYCLWQLHHTRAEGERFADALITQNGQDLPRDPDMYGPQVFADFACDFIEKNAGSEKPFFIYYPMVLVHDPFVPTPDSPEWANPERRYENDTAYFADMMAFTDKIVGQIEKVLKENDKWENTLIIFTADNGTHPTVISSTTYGKVKGAKGQSINDGNRVPMIVNWPEKIKSKFTTGALLSFNDFLPTLCEAAGISTEKFETDGVSFVPVLTGQQEKLNEEIFIHYTPRWGRWEHNRWVMNGEFKLYRDGRFYNTAKDALEKHPLESLTETEQKLNERFQQILNKKEQEVPFSMNNEEYKLEN